MATAVMTAVVLRERSTLRAYTYGPNEHVPTDAICIATIEFRNGKYDKGRLRQALITAAKKAGLNPGDIRDLNRI